MITELLGRQSEETKLRESIEDLSETLKATYNRKVLPAVNGGVGGAGLTRSSFFDTLGLSGLAQNIKEKAEAREIDRQKKEAFVQDFQDNSDAGKILSPATARAIAETMYEEQKNNPVEEEKKEATVEQTEAATISMGKLDDLFTLSETFFIEMLDRANIMIDNQGKNLEYQNKIDDDLVSLYTISDDFFKSMLSNSPSGGNPYTPSTEQGIEAQESQKDQIELQVKVEDTLTDLFIISDDYFKEMLKRSDEFKKIFEAILDKTGSGISIGLDGMPGTDAGGKGGKTPPGKTSKLGKVGGVLGKGLGILGAAVAIGGAVSDISDVNDQVASGKLSSDQGNVRKGEIGGGLAGGLGGAAAGAALGTAILPGVGTIIGGALGYFGGEAAGSWLGGTAVQASQGGTSKPEEILYGPNGEIIGTVPVEDIKPVDAGAKRGAPFSVNNQPMPSLINPSVGDSISTATSVVNNSKSATGEAQTNVNNVNAPVMNVVNNTTNTAPKTPKNSESTFTKYVERKYYPV